MTKGKKPVLSVEELDFANGALEKDEILHNLKPGVLGQFVESMFDNSAKERQRERYANALLQAGDGAATDRTHAARHGVSGERDGKLDSWELKQIVDHLKHDRPDLYKKIAEDGKIGLEELAKATIEGKVYAHEAAMAPVVNSVKIEMKDTARGR